MQHNVDRTAQSIAHLNDQARTTLTNCKLMVTRGIDLLGEEAVYCILDLVKRVYDQPFISVFVWLENVHAPCNINYFDDWAEVEQDLAKQPIEVS